MSTFFSPDRLRKYQWGSLRLAVIICVALYCSRNDDCDSSNPTTPAPATSEFVGTYLTSLRWLGHAYIGSIGAMVNVNIFSFNTNLVLLALAGLFISWDIYAVDASMLIYALKTFGGDYFAGKLDTTEWLLVLFFSVIICPALFYIAAGTLAGMIAAKYARILLILFVIQLICECGDNFFESWAFFRYRYSYELFNVLVIFVLPLHTFERHVTLYDMMICLFYRLSNMLIICERSGLISLFVKKLMFRIAGLKLGVRVMLVDNPVTALAVLKQSNHKGFFLERLGQHVDFCVGVLIVRPLML
jgi:hypothetical protein